MTGLRPALLVAALPATVCLLLLPASHAGAQPCQVSLEPAMRVFGPDPAQCDNQACASTVRIAMDPTTQLPLVIWYGDDGETRLSRFDGTSWSSPEVIPTEGIMVPRHIGIDTTFEAIAHAVDSQGLLHLVISDGTNVYYMQKGAGWSSPQAIHTIPHIDLTALEIFAEVDGQDRLHVVYWYEAGIGFVHYARRSAGVWSDWTDLGYGRHVDMAVSSAGEVHVSSINKLGNVGDLVNWQVFYQNMNESGVWSNATQITTEPPVSTIIGPLAIQPSVAVDAQGQAHLAYPVDPTDDLGDDDGHASYMWRNASGSWSTPLPVMQNARHSAMLRLVVDSANVKYLFGLNRARRYAVAVPSESWVTGQWHTEADGLWMFFDATNGPSGAWLAYVPHRRWGPVEVLHARRTGSCACEETGGCAAGQTETRSCGQCGTQSRVCGNYCQWSAWSECNECTDPQDGAVISDGGEGVTDSGMVGNTGSGMTRGCSCGAGGRPHQGSLGFAGLAMLIGLVLGVSRMRSMARLGKTQPAPSRSAGRDPRFLGGRRPAHGHYRIQGGAQRGASGSCGSSQRGSPGGP